jgi:chromosome segregation ATPase
MELRERLKDISQQLDTTSEKMQQSDLIALETIEKMEEISELMHELASDEMKEIMQKLQEAMDEIDPEKVQQALKQMDVSQEETLKRLERTIEMLKRVRAERQMEAAVEKARRLMKDQERLAEKTEQADRDQMEKLAQEQEALKDRLEKYMEELEELAKNLDEIDPQGAKETREAAQQCKNQQIPEDMQQAANGLKQQNQSQATQFQQDASDKLRGLFQKMRQCQGGCQMRAQGEALAEMERAIRNLLGISKAQEELVDDIASTKRATRSSVEELTERQTDLMQSTKRVGNDMYELSKKTFFITPQIMRSIAQALHQMQNAGFSLEQTRSPSAINNGERAMSSLNQAVISLLESHQSCSSCGQSGSQLSQMLQQLRQMSDRQGDLNQAMEEMLRQMDQMSEMNPSLMETLARLKAEQMSLQQSVEQLGREYGERKEVLGRLDSIGEEMKKVIKEMEEQRVSQSTIERQRRILSRLLDAQLSLTKRDFTRKRVSRTGEDYLNRTSPPSIADELGSEEEIREDLLRALKGNFPEEYRDLIKAYFQELSRRSAEAGG